MVCVTVLSGNANSAPLISISLVLLVLFQNSERSHFTLLILYVNENLN